MDKDKYIEIVNEKLTNENSKKIMIDSINKYYYFKDKINILNKYNIGDNVLLPKGTLLHGTYKNLDGLKYIVKNGLICHNFVEAREGTKYPYSVGVWNIKEECLLKDYIDYYSGGTIKFNGFMKDGKQNIDKEIISYSNLNNLTKIINDKS